MGAGNHGGFGATAGARAKNLIRINLQFFASKVFEKGGRITKDSFSKHAEFFLGKSADKIAKEMKKHGYQVHIEKSTHQKSKAKKIIVDNPSEAKNISSIQVSPGTGRHGNTSYVKVSTNDIGKLKIVSDKTQYKSDGKEKSRIYFARRKKR